MTLSVLCYMKNRKRLVYRRAISVKIIVQSRNLLSIKNFVNITGIFGKKKITELNGMYEIKKIVSRYDLLNIDNYAASVIGQNVWIYIYQHTKISIYHNNKKGSYPIRSIFSFSECESYKNIQSFEDAIWDFIKEYKRYEEIIKKLELIKNDNLFISIIEEMKRTYVEMLNLEEENTNLNYRFKERTAELLKSLNPYIETLELYKNISYPSFLKVCEMIKD